MGSTDLTAKLESKIDELALTLLTAGEELNDNDLNQSLVTLTEIVTLAASDQELLRLANAAEATVAEAADQSSALYTEALQAVLPLMQQFLAKPDSVEFPHEVVDARIEADWRDRGDPDFMPEFIEKYTLLFEDYQGALVEYQMAVQNLDPATNQQELQECQEALHGWIKSYFHTLKGDSGSIGLIKIERLCHDIEDLFNDVSAYKLLTELDLFREWLGTYLDSYVNEAEVPEPPEYALALFTERASALSPVTDTDADRAAVESEVSPEPPADHPNANMDLLAELMADEEFKDIVDHPPSEEPEPEQPQPETDAPLDRVELYEIEGDIELVTEFIQEAEEHLNNVEAATLDAESESSRESCDTIFRGIHSIKGASLFFKLFEINQISHITETILSDVRDGKRPFDKTLQELVFEYIDIVRKLLQQARDAVTSGANALTWNKTSRIFLRKLEGVLENPGEPPAEEETAEPDKPDQAPSPQSLSAAQQLEEKSQSKRPAVEVKSFVKVDTQRLDQLIDAIGEMVIYSSMLIKDCRELLPNNTRILQTSHQVEKFSKNLQDLGMAMRLIPIKGLFQKMSRIVWDVSKKIEKEINLRISGEETELDRLIIDQLADPLMHMVRNAIDHGIEMPDDGEKKGKPRQGYVHLSAEHAGGSIHIAVQDDGNGLDPERLRAKAIEKGIISAEAKLTEQESYQLLFAPGFSTAKEVTDISGRGVGMDVVRRNIENIRGHVNIESEIGKGTKFTIELPLTLAIIDGIEIAVGDELYIIPTLSVVEFVQPEPGTITRTLDRFEVFNFRGQYLPIYRLGALFGVAAKCADPCDATIIVVEMNGFYAALMVDEILGTSSTVIKNLGDFVENQEGVAGCAIMPNGTVALILDLRSLLKLARSTYAYEHQAIETNGVINHESLLDLQDQSTPPDVIVEH